MVRLLKRYPNSFYLPCTDAETELLARWSLLSDTPQDEVQLVQERSLGVSLSCMDSTAKPDIPAGQMLGLKIPEYLVVDDKMSLMEVHSFCLVHGYPVVVKVKRARAHGSRAVLIACIRASIMVQAPAFHGRL